MSDDRIAEIRKPCEYCGVNLPLGVSKETRRVRSFHFANCEKRLQITPPPPDIEAQSDALLAEVDRLRAEKDLDASSMVLQRQEIERLTREQGKARTEIERLREALTEISQYETSAPAGFEWDIVVEELVEIACKALEAKP